MDQQGKIDFDRIRKAIGYLNDNYKAQPDLDEVAAYVHMSSYHFQRMFTDWAGVSPKQFLQYISIEYAKGILKENSSSLFDAAYEVGLSGTGRLHDLFVKIEGMTPGEYKNGGKDLSVNYSFFSTIFGEILIATTSKGICYMAFSDNQTEVLEELFSLFPNAIYQNIIDDIQHRVISIFTSDWKKLDEVKLHIKGTDFQIKVWEALLKIPKGKLSSYSDISAIIGKPEANRAVGSAIGHNPVAYLIPCHRVIQSTGLFGQYHWGSDRKAAMIGWERANISSDKS